MKTLFCRVVLVCLAILLIASASFGQVTDNTTGSGNWSAPATWSLGLVPNNGNGGNNYNVVFLTSSGATVTLDISPTIDMLTLQSSTNLQASTTISGLTLTTTGLTTAGDITLNNNDTLIVNGTATNSGVIDLDKNTTLTVNGSFTNTGTLETNVQNQNVAGHPNTVTVTGTFTNNAGANLNLGFFGDTADVMNVGTLSNSGNLTINNGATLNMTGQPNGITDVVGGSNLVVDGTLSAGANNGLFKLGSIEGVLIVGTGQTFTDTPGSGTLTISGELDLENFNGSATAGTNMTISGNLTNSGDLFTNIQNHVQAGKFNTLTVTGTFTNNSGATTHIGFFGDTTDVMNVATLVNNGILEIDNGATLNLTAQPNGITDVVAGSQLFDYGTIKAGSANGLAKLGSVEGLLVVGNGQTFTDTPGSGTLTISSSGEMDLENFDVLGGAGTNLTVAGNLTVASGGQLYTNVQNRTQSGGPNTLTVTGTFTNSGTTHIGFFGDTTDVMNVATLVNNGVVQIDPGATLNLTGQPNGVTDVLGGSQLFVYGTLSAGVNNGLANLGSIEGLLVVGNGQNTTITPGAGTLTISSSGELDVENFIGSPTAGTNVTISGNLTNSGQLYTNIQNRTQGKTNTLTVTGNFINNAGATTHIGFFGDTTDVMNVTTLVNNGVLQIDPGATLNLTAQASGVTDVVANSQLLVYGTLKAGANNGLANLGSIEGLLVVGNGQTTTLNPGGISGGTLTISSSGELDVENFIGTPTAGTNVTISGNLINSGHLYTNIQNRTQGKTNTLTVTGTFTNNATTHIGFFGDTTDVMNVGSLNNSGSGTITVDTGATLNLTGATGTNTGIILVNHGATLDITNPETLTNNGTIDVGDTVGGGTFKINGNTTLTGTTGKVILSNFAGNVIGGTGTLTNVKNTISGSGNIGNGTAGLNNQGTIDANQSVPLIIQAMGTVQNSLTMEATSGATLQLDAGNYTQTSAGNILASETGNARSAVNLESGVSITGGKLTTTGTTATINLVGTNPLLTLNGVSISGTGKLILPDGSTTTLLGTINNTSTIDVNGATAPTKLVVGGTSVTLSGTGKIILTDNANNQFTGATSTDILHNGNTIEGAGNIGEGNMGLINTGTIETLAHQVNILEIDASSSGFSNQGILLAATGSTLYIDNATNQFLNFSGTTLTGGTYTVDGTLKFDGANIVTNAANITLSGSTSKIIDQSNGDGLANFATNASGGTFALAAGRNFTTIGNFTNNGTLNIGAGTKFAVGTNGAANLTNFSGTTLTGGTYIVAGILQFFGANIVTNDASITLSGAAAKIEDQTDANALANFATNGTGSTFALASSAKFSTSGNFTNNGTLNVATGTKFSTGVNGASNLTNYASNTLTGGSYIATGTGQIQFNNEATTGGIKTNAASITLSGATSTASLIDQNGTNMLANFATNSSTGSFTLISSRTFTTAAGFTNAGIIQISKTTTFTVGPSGNYAQTGGATTVDGTLAVGSAAAVNISGGSLFGNGGTINGNVDLTGGTVNPGDGLNAIGDIKVSGTYIQGSGGTLNIDLNGITPNTKYDVLNITGAATLGGTLNFDLIAGFTPTVGQSFTVINYASETGSFATVNLPTAPPNTHWTFTCDPTDCTLTLNSGLVAPGAATTGTVSASPARRVTRSAGVLASTSSTHEPVAILSHVTCLATRLLGSASCDRSSAAVVSRGNELHAVASAGSGLGTVHNNVMPATARPTSGAVHNNVMIASRSIASARGGASRETSISATAMARFYVCAYLPSSVGHTMGCN